MAKAKSFITSGFIEFQEDKIKELTDSMPWMNDREMVLARSVQEVAEFVDEAINKGICALDLETSGLNSRVRKRAKDVTTSGPNVIAGTTGDIFGDVEPVERIVGFCLSCDPKKGMYVPINHRIEPETNLSERLVVREIRRLCKNCITIYHHSKFDLQFLYNYGIEISQHDRFEDTMLLARLYDAGQKDIKLKNLSDRLLNQPMLTFKEVCKEERFDLVPPRVGYKYGASDAICTLDLFNYFMAEGIVRDQIPV